MVFGYINLSRLVLQGMKARGRGAVINVVGFAGERLAFDYIVGSTGNAALIAFTRALGSRSLEDGIRVLGINPGIVLTDRVVSLYRQLANRRWGDESRYAELLGEHRKGMLVEPEDVADLMTFLASERARRISGSIVAIDGGLAAYHALGDN
jgi:NAD(P)-dependent dehydrogenase (short-subunit alcohol dehydrogenase family)